MRESYGCEGDDAFMACCKTIDRSPKFLPVVLSGQLLPGTFEHALNHLLDHEVDLSGLDERLATVRML